MDQQLHQAAHPVGEIVAGGDHFGGPGAFGPLDSIPPGSYGAFLDASGTTIQEHSFTYGGDDDDAATPVLPGGLPGSTEGGLTPPSTTFSSDAIPASASPFRVLANAARLDDQQATL